MFLFFFCYELVYIWDSRWKDSIHSSLNKDLEYDAYGAYLAASQYGFPWLRNSECQALNASYWRGKLGFEDRLLEEAKSGNSHQKSAVEDVVEAAHLRVHIKDSTY